MKNIKNTGKAKYSRKEEKQIVSSFAKRFVESQRDIEPEIAKVVQERFWEML